MRKVLLTLAMGFLTAISLNVNAANTNANANPNASNGNVVGNANAGKGKAAVCSACHGVDGISTLPQAPNLKGQRASYLVEQLTAFKDGKRVDPNGLMTAAAGLSDQDIADLAAYYGGLQ